ncbi:MAG: toll/interleukin-1 receptor domain-containing protein [Firmicutes bacterium]|nr:toll/interleukin-1 receptor domain-containing protein [Bacillota bacterium]
MAIFKCKMCGGDLNIQQGMTVCECEFCGTTQTIPSADDEKKTNLFNRATQLRRANEFDRAISVYEQLINEFPDEAEAYWGLVLCKYGIEYVDDPLTYRKIPTCHRTSYESIFDDVNYKQAIEKADPVACSVYEDEAKVISDIQKGILRIAKNEKPFDIFICYKETDELGNRTQDSVLAQDLYYQLTESGFKVFFSKITLEGKLGTQYEPYIFAALNSAKVMVVVGTKPEYYNAVWLKNEWSRFLALMKQDKNKIIIPAYRDMDPYDLPDALSMFQSQDMSKLGFMQDLIRGIKKILHKDEEEKVTTKTIREPVSVNSKINNLLKRGMFSLEEGNTQEANIFFERVLDENAEEARAYLGKLMIDLNYKTENDFNTGTVSFTDNKNYNNILKFGDTDFVTKVKEYNALSVYNKALSYKNDIKGLGSLDQRDQLFKAKKLFLEIQYYKDSKEQADECDFLASECIYQEAVNLMKKAKNSNDCNNANFLLMQIKGFKDVDNLIEELAEIEKNIEKERIYNSIIQTINKAEKKQTATGALNLYNEAFSIIEQGVVDGYKDIESYRDICVQKIGVLSEAASLEKAQAEAEAEASRKENQYQIAENALKHKDYVKASEIFREIYEYKNSKQELKICEAQIASIRRKATFEKHKDKIILVLLILASFSIGAIYLKIEIFKSLKISAIITVLALAFLLISKLFTRDKYEDSEGCGCVIGLFIIVFIIVGFLGKLGFGPTLLITIFILFIIAAIFGG